MRAYLDNHIFNVETEEKFEEAWKKLMANKAFSDNARNYLQKNWYPTRSRWLVSSEHKYSVWVCMWL